MEEKQKKNLKKYNTSWCPAGIIIIPGTVVVHINSLNFHKVVVSNI